MCKFKKYSCIALHFQGILWKLALNVRLNVYAHRTFSQSAPSTYTLLRIYAFHQCILMMRAEHTRRTYWERSRRAFPVHHAECAVNALSMLYAYVLRAFWQSAPSTHALLRKYAFHQCFPRTSVEQRSVRTGCIPRTYRDFFVPTGDALPTFTTAVPSLAKPISSKFSS